jgi:hypothetical protein
LRHGAAQICKKKRYVMKNVLLVLGVVVSTVAGAAELNPFPIRGNCSLVLDGGAGGAIETNLEETVVLPPLEICPSAELLLSGTYKGKTYSFSGELLRSNGTNAMFIQLNKLVGDARVEIGSAVVSGEVQLVPGASAYGQYSIIEDNKHIGYFACGMTVQPEGDLQ